MLRSPVLRRIVRCAILSSARHCLRWMMSGSRSRNKGARGEREVANILRAAGYDVNRTNQSDGAHSCDVDGVPGVWIEVKRSKRVNVRAGFRQACNDTDGREPVVIWRDDRGEWMVDCRLEAWIKWVAGL